MRLGGNAQTLADIESKNDLIEINNIAKNNNQPIFVIGGGSNIIAHDEGFSGILIRMKIPGFEIQESNEDSTIIRIGAGEDWDSVVKRSTDLNLSGIETMAGIPGTAGAAPVQNVGAYGQEIADTLVSVEAYDTQTNDFVILSSYDCNFSYRDSIFRSTMSGRYVITSILIKLSKNKIQPPFYDSLQRYLDENNISDYSPTNIRNAVLKIRNNKLPDPKYFPSAGSFFKNAIVEALTAERLSQNFPGISLHKTDDGMFKVPTGWLIDQSGLKGKLIHGMRVYEKNALVLVNESANSYDNLAAARKEIIDTVFDKFQIKIEQEPLEI